MSGSITTANGAAWRAAGWVFRNILDGTAEVLRSLEMLEIAELSQEDQTHFCKALQLCYQHHNSAGSKGWRSPDFFPGFMARFGELVAMTAVEGRHGTLE